MSTGPFTPEQIEVATRDVLYARAVAYTSVASTVFLLYDHILTLNKERVTIWNAKLNLGKIMFLINRYFTPTSLLVQLYSYVKTEPSLSYCRIWFQLDMACAYLTLGLVQGVLMLRVWVVYHRSMKILIGLMALTVLVTIPMIAIVAVVVTGMDYVPPPVPRIMEGCYVTGPFHIFFAFWIPLLVLDVVNFVLMMWKAWESYQETRMRNPIMRVLFKDGVIYFLLVCGAVIANIIIWLRPETSIQQLFIQMHRCCLSWSCNRILMNLRFIVHPSRTTTMVSTMNHSSRLTTWAAASNKQQHTMTTTYDEMSAAAAMGNWSAVERQNRFSGRWSNAAAHNYDALDLETQAQQAQGAMMSEAKNWGFLNVEIEAEVPREEDVDPAGGAGYELRHR